MPWNAESLYAYLRKGWDADHGTARGPMAEVVRNLSAVPASDVRAIAVYMADVHPAIKDYKTGRARSSGPYGPW